MSLGTLEIAGRNFGANVLLAPMSGVTNSCFRRLIRRLNPGAVGLVVTEFISIEGMTRSNEQSLRMMRFSEEERPISIQIFGHDIDRMVNAAKMVQDAGADIVDINSGCPVPKVVKRGGGCELMRQPQHLANVLTAVRKAVSIPLTLKIRSGWDEKNRNGIAIAHMAQECGVDMLAVHGRTRQQLYRGDADWDFVREVVHALSIPVVGSGDIVDSTSAADRLSSGVAGIMIGRAALQNPWVFSELQAGFLGKPYCAPDALSTPHVLRQYLELLSTELCEKAAMGRLKQFASQVTRRVPGSSSVRRDLCMAKSFQEFLQHLNLWEEHLNALALSPECAPVSYASDELQGSATLSW